MNRIHPFIKKKNTEKIQKRRERGRTEEIVNNFIYKNNLKTVIYDNFFLRLYGITWIVIKKIIQNLKTVIYDKFFLRLFKRLRDNFDCYKKKLYKI